MIQRYGDLGMGSDKVYELNEKSHDSMNGQMEQLLYDDTEISPESKFILEEEPAISDDGLSENGSKSSSDDLRSYKVSFLLLSI